MPAPGIEPKQSDCLALLLSTSMAKLFLIEPGVEYVAVLLQSYVLTWLFINMVVPPLLDYEFVSTWTMFY